MTAVDASHDQVLLALIAVIAAAMTSLGFVIRALLDRQEQRVTQYVQQTRAGVERIEGAVNHVESDVATPNGKPTLGRMVRDLVERVDEGFNANDETHRSIVGMVEQATKRIDANTRRLDQLEDRTVPTTPSNTTRSRRVKKEP